MSIPEPEHRRMLVNGRVTHFLVAGQGEPVVAVHGLSGSSRWWLSTLPALTPHFRVYLIDLPGFGAGARRERFVLTDAPNWLIDWLAAAGLDRAHLIGHSMGGSICLQVAATRPNLVDRLVLVAPAGLADRRTILGQSRALLLSVRGFSPGFLRVLIHDAIRTGPHALWRTARDVQAHDVGGLLGQIRAPTLLVWGDRDQLVPLSLGRTMLDAIPNARLSIIQGAAHVPMYERPAEFNDILLSFLKGKSAGE